MRINIRDQKTKSNHMVPKVILKGFSKEGKLWGVNVFEYKKTGEFRPLPMTVNKAAVKRRGLHQSVEDLYSEFESKVIDHNVKHYKDRYNLIISLLLRQSVLTVLMNAQIMRNPEAQKFLSEARQFIEEYGEHAAVAKLREELNATLLDSVSLVKRIIQNCVHFLPYIYNNHLNTASSNKGLFIGFFPIVTSIKSGYEGTVAIPLLSAKWLILPMSFDSYFYCPKSPHSPGNVIEVINMHTIARQMVSNEACFVYAHPDTNLVWMEDLIERTRLMICSEKVYNVTLAKEN